jgi:alpha-N-arabinofuranosidase
LIGWLIDSQRTQVQFGRGECISLKSIKDTSPPIEGPVGVLCVGGNENDIRDTNKWDSQRVGNNQTTWDCMGKFLFQKYSFFLLRWKGNHPRSNIDDVDDPASGTSAIVLNACIRLDRAY